MDEESLRALLIEYLSRSLKREKHATRLKAHLKENEERLFQCEASPPTELPWLAERAACLLVSRSDGDSTLGDLEEKYRKYVARHGPRFALVWYWWQVGSLLGPRLRSLLLWIGGLAGLKKALDWIGKLGGS